MGGERLERGPDVLDDDRGQRRGLRAEHRDRAGPAGLDGVVVTVGVLAGEGHEEAAGLGLPAVEHGRRGHGHGAVAHGRPADDGGDVAEAERDRAQGGWFAGGHGPSQGGAVLPPRTRIPIGRRYGPAGGPGQPWLTGVMGKSK